MKWLAVCGLTGALLVAILAPGAMAQTARTNREAVSHLIEWVKASGEKGFLEGRLAKALGSTNSDDVPVMARVLIGRNSIMRLMVPDDMNVLVLRRGLGDGGERIWKASLVREGDIATLEPLFISTGRVSSELTEFSLTAAMTDFLPT